MAIYENRCHRKSIEVYGNMQVMKDHNLVEKQESFVRFCMLPNTFWMILDDSC